jgi:hypothetical protein
VSIFFRVPPSPHPRAMTVPTRPHVDSHALQKLRARLTRLVALRPIRGGPDAPAAFWTELDACVTSIDGLLPALQGAAVAMTLEGPGDGDGDTAPSPVSSRGSLRSLSSLPPDVDLDPRHRTPFPRPSSAFCRDLSLPAVPHLEGMADDNRSPVRPHPALPQSLPLPALHRYRPHLSSILTKAPPQSRPHSPVPTDDLYPAPYMQNLVLFGGPPAPHRYPTGAAPLTPKAPRRASFRDALRETVRAQPTEEAP